MKISNITYMVEYKGMKYYYPLHSEKRGLKLIYPSQVINLLEYLLFNALKDGSFKSYMVDEKNFPFAIRTLENREVVKEDVDSEIKFATYIILQQYLNNVASNFLSKKAQ